MNGLHTVQLFVDSKTDDALFHCLWGQVRSGVKRLRVVDFDQVSLSSLNRHAVANWEDVGFPKVFVLVFQGLLPPAKCLYDGFSISPLFPVIVL